MCRKIIAVAGRTANNQRLQGAIVFPNPNYSTTESGKVCELGFPEKTPSGFPLVIITPIGKNCGRVASGFHGRTDGGRGGSPAHCYP